MPTFDAICCAWAFCHFRGENPFRDRDKKGESPSSIIIFIDLKNCLRINRFHRIMFYRRRSLFIGSCEDGHESFSWTFFFLFSCLLRKTKDEQTTRKRNDYKIQCLLLVFFCPSSASFRYINIKMLNIYNTRLMAKIYKFIRSVPHSSALVLGVRPTEWKKST